MSEQHVPPAAQVGPSLIRTAVPIIVGHVVALLALLDVELTSATADQLTTFVGAVLSITYYLAARFLEQRYAWARWLLGSPSRPVYIKE